MKILGIESSCDETAAAVIEDGKRLLSNVVNSQIDIHAEYGGVIPEIAARSHIEVINPVVNKALKESGCTWDDIDAIAVTYAPGLVGSLLVGTLAARTLAIIHNKPLYKIHHVEAHVYANFIVEDKERGERPSASAGSAFPAERTQENNNWRVRVSAEDDGSEPVQPAKSTVNNGSGVKKALALPTKQPSFPLLALIVSGGHSQLVFFRNHGDYDLIGQTQDDAVGEAFDKVAKILGLPYPGGPSIAKAAELGDSQAYKLPIAKLEDRYNFSFSGLKTAVLRAVQAAVGKDYSFPSHELPALVTDELRHNMAASFQHTAVKTLVDKAKLAYDDLQPKSVVIAGGVAANHELRKQLSAALPINIEYAPIQLCTDNASMIAALAYYRQAIDQSTNPYELEVVPSLSM